MCMPLTRKILRVLGSVVAGLFVIVLILAAAIRGDQYLLRRKAERLPLLLDEHISPDVANGLRRRNRTIEVRYMVEWKNGHFLGPEDSACLREAAALGLTLVTYDRRTIPPLLKTWAEEERTHGGVIFVDERTISPADIGGLVWALTRLLGETANRDWTNQVYFLRR